LLVTQGHYPSFNECVPGHTKTGGDCNRGLTSVLRKHNMKVESESQVFLDANPAGHVYADEHTEGDTGRAVRQVPHDRLSVRSTFGGEGDVAHLLQFSAQMEMDEIRCVRLVAARLRGTELDDKTLTWGASGKSAWGQNVLTGAAAECRTAVMASEMLIIHPQAFLQPERAINLTPDNKAATARVFVKLHNNMQCVPQREGFSLLNHDAHHMLTEDAAFHKFSEMSNIGPWIDREGKLQWDYVISAGFKGARSVRNGNLGGTANKAAHIETEGYIINEHGKQCITGLRDISIMGGLDELHTHICISALCRRGVSVRWEKGYAVYGHRCCDPQLSGMEGQKIKQKKGLTLQMCKKCHRTAKECKRGDRCWATCNTTNRKSCQHLH